MLGTGIDVQVAVQGVAQTIFRKHATDGVFKNALGMAGEHLGRCEAIAAAIPNGKAHVVTRNFPMEAAALQRKLGLAAQDVGHTGSQTAYGLILGINEHPFLLDGLLVG